MSESRLAALAARGQSVWIDILSRRLVRSGELARLIEDDAVTGVTSNPTIFQKAIAGGDYDDDIVAGLEPIDDPREVFHELAIGDVREACDVLAPVFEATGGRDGYVSLEVDPGLAYDPEGTVEQATDLHHRVERANLYVKIPATIQGVGAIEECIARGIPINVTLIFSLLRYAQVAEAYIRGLSRLMSDGHDPSGVTSVASFFVSRLDTEADPRLEAVGRADLAGRLGVANARLAYAQFQSIFSGPAWEPLDAAGATKQRPLWASTSTKNPAYSDVMYVEELVGPHTVDTMPPETLAAFRDHGEVRGDTVLDHLDEAEELMSVLPDGFYDDVVETLEREGVSRFADSFDELVAAIEAKRGELAAR